MSNDIAGLVDYYGIERFLVRVKEVCLAQSEESEPDKAAMAWWANIAMGLENTIAVAEEGE